MEKMNLYIDFVRSDNGSDRLFGLKLQERFRKIEGVTLSTFEDFRSTAGWEQDSINGLDWADVIFAIVSPDYLGYITSKVEKTMKKIAESAEQTLLPIIFRESEWKAYPWLAQSNPYPQNGSPVIYYDDQETEEFIEELARGLQEVMQDGTYRKKIRVGRKIFISHADEDSDFAEVLKIRLKDSEIECWLDNSELKVGQEWQEKIDMEIDQSAGMIVVLSPAANKSSYVMYEWVYAMARKKPVFPVMIKKTPMHPRFNIQYLDFTNVKARPYEELINSIRAQLIRS